MKASFLLVGHTHDDVDAVIGSVISYLRGVDIFSFAEFEAACKLAISSVEALSRVVRVERVVGITDYEEIFATHTAGLQLVGITNLQEARISVNTVGAVQVLYKDDVTTTGWFPRPVPHYQCSLWRTAFPHPDAASNAGNPLSMKPVANTEPGRRQSYHYDITYANKSQSSFDLPCPTLPIVVDRVAVLEKIRLFRHQPFANESWFGSDSKEGKSKVVLRSIIALLKHRQQDKHIPEWQRLFAQEFPQSLRAVCDGQQSTLAILAREYGGDVQIKPLVAIKAPTGTISSYLDPIVFRGMPLPMAERTKILLELGLLPTNPRKKRTAKDAAVTTTVTAPARVPKTVVAQKAVNKRSKIKQLSTSSDNNDEEEFHSESLHDTSSSSSDDESVSGTRVPVLVPAQVAVGLAAPPVAPTHDVIKNAYLELRADNISRNNAELRRLGFPTTHLAALPTKKVLKSKGRLRRTKSSSDESDDQQPIYNYMLLDKAVDIVNPMTLFDFIGRQFEDIEENIIFEVTGLCKSEVRGVEDYFYSYFEVGKRNTNVEYTLCAEMLHNSAVWILSPVLVAQKSLLPTTALTPAAPVAATAAKTKPIRPPTHVYLSGVELEEYKTKVASNSFNSVVSGKRNRTSINDNN